MLAGYMDYTPGAMTNAQPENFAVRSERPMSQGTRAHQLGMYVVYYAPLQMLSDAPTAYLAEPDVLAFLRQVPTTWDQTVPLAGVVGEYAVTARRKGDVWYVGAVSAGNARTVTLDLSALGTGDWQADIYQDGVNADRLAEDYRHVQRTVRAGEPFTLQLARNGGAAMRLVRP